MQKKILILGGYGNTGNLIGRLLLQESNVRIVTAGRSLVKAQQHADRLNHEFNTDRVSHLQVDAADRESLQIALKGIDIILVASSTVEYTNNVAKAALEADVDYFDTQMSSRTKLEVLNSLRDSITQNGRCFITDGGYHPGVPAAMARYAANRMDVLEKAVISAAFQLNWKELEVSDSTSAEFIEELSHFMPTAYKDGVWVEIRMSQLPEFELGELFGKLYCIPMYMEEIQSLPDLMPSLCETGFYIAGFNWVTDYIIMPIAMLMLKLFGDSAKQPMGKFFNWGLRHFSKPPFGAVLQMEAEGQKDNAKRSVHMRLAHEDAYVLTAVPVVACLLQYLNGDIRREGLWLQANIVEPIKFFEDIERLGIKTIVTTK